MTVKHFAFFLFPGEFFPCLVFFFLFVTGYGVQFHSTHTPSQYIVLGYYDLPPAIPRYMGRIGILPMVLLLCGGLGCRLGLRQVWDLYIAQTSPLYVFIFCLVFGSGNNTS